MILYKRKNISHKNLAHKKFLIYGVHVQCMLWANILMLLWLNQVSMDHQEQLISDNGSQFTSEEFMQFLRLSRVKHIRSAPYHPSSNGAVERFIRTFKHSIKAGSSKHSFHHQLMRFLLSYRTTPHASTKVTPAELYLNWHLRTRLDLLHPSSEDAVSASQTKQKQSRDMHSRAWDFNLFQRVLVQNYQQGPGWLPAADLALLPTWYKLQEDNYGSGIVTNFFKQQTVLEIILHQLTPIRILG